jgi:hypothetical protein
VIGFVVFYKKDLPQKLTVETAAKDGGVKWSQDV